MPSACSIAVAQTRPVRGDVEANVHEHLRLIQVAASEGAQLVLFPELSLTGYEPGLAESLAFSEADSRLSPLIDAAARASISVIAGAPVRTGAALHIGAFVLRPDRSAGLYTKHRLGAFSARAAVDGTVPAAEATVFQAGNRNPLVAFGGRTAAIAICADIGLRSHARQAKERGARAYLASMFVIPSEYDADSKRLQEYARQHALTVALANFGGRSGGLAAAGRSAIWSETGERLVQLDASGAGLAVATESSDGWHGRAVMLDPATDPEG